MMKSVINPAITWLLRSPLHWLLSGSVLLVTVAGRQTGREYTLPVNYRLVDGLVEVLTLRPRTWWRNVRPGTAVQLRLRGRDLAAWGEVIPPAAAPGTGAQDDRFVHVRFHLSAAKDQHEARRRSA